MNEKIGVIVPVYKTEKYVAECIESILAQTYTNFRLILVDDGSPDSAGTICDEYATKDPRITIIHQENAGVTRARARGVEEATDCEWITFVDSDDMLAKIALNELINHASSETDIILCTSYYTETSSHVCLLGFNEYKNKSIDIVDFRKKMITMRGGMPWGRMFRRGIIDAHALDIPREIYYGEDAIMNLRISFNTENKIPIIEKDLYFYRQNQTGVCNNFKFTHQHEELRKQHILQSIPHTEFNKYINEYIEGRVWLWKVKFSNSIKRPSWSNTELHKNLIEDIRKYKYKIPFFEWALIKYSNPAMRFFIIMARKGSSLFKRII